MKQIFTHKRSPKVGKKQKTEERERNKERLNNGNKNGQATHGARKHAWRKQAAWAKKGERERDWTIVITMAKLCFHIHLSSETRNWSRRMYWPLLTLTIALPLSLFLFFFYTHCFSPTLGMLRKLKFYLTWDNFQEYSSVTTGSFVKCRKWHDKSICFCKVTLKKTSTNIELVKTQYGGQTHRQTRVCIDHSFWINYLVGLK